MQQIDVVGNVIDIMEHLRPSRTILTLDNVQVDPETRQSRVAQNVVF